GPLGAVQTRRDFHLHAYTQVALAIALQVLDATALEAKYRAGLRARRNFYGRAAFECGYFNFIAQRRLYEAHGDLANQIVAIACENFMFLYGQKDVKIASRAAAKTGFTVTLRTQPRSAFHTGGDSEFDLGRALAFAITVAGFAGLFKDPALAFTVGTGLSDA